MVYNVSWNTGVYATLIKLLLVLIIATHDRISSRAERTLR